MKINHATQKYTFNDALMIFAQVITPHIPFSSYLYISLLFGLYPNYTKLKPANLPLTEETMGI